MRTLAALLLATTLSACAGGGPACSPADEANGELSVGSVAFVGSVIVMTVGLRDAPGTYGKALAVLIGSALVGAGAGMACESIRDGLGAPSADEARQALHKVSRLVKAGEGGSARTRGP